MCAANCHHPKPDQSFQFSDRRSDRCAASNSLAGMIFDFFPYSGVRCGPARPLCNRREKSINSPKKGPDCFVNVGLASSSRKRYLASTIFHSCRKWQQKHHSWSRLSCARALSYRRHGGCLCIVHTLCRRCPRSYRDVHCDSVQCTNRNHGDFAVLFIS